MGIAFFDDRHKQQKLHGTICFYRGEPYYVSCYVDEFRPHVKPLKEGHVRLTCLGPNLNDESKTFDIDYRDKEFDYNAPPLGYTTWKGVAHYVMRRPQRTNQQGLTAGAVTSSSGLLDVYGWFGSTECRSCILGEHPTLAEALALCDRRSSARATSVAFHRNLAVSGLGLGAGHTLYFKGRSIGNRIGRDTSFVLFPGPDQSFLLKYLHNNGVAAC